MNPPTRPLIIGAITLALAAGLSASWASCGSAALISTTNPVNLGGAKSFVWTENVFTPNYYVGYPGYGPVMYPGNPPVTGAFQPVSGR